MLVEAIFQYRTLIGKCELGVGLEWDEIETVTIVEAAFEPAHGNRRSGQTNRRYRRETVQLTAIMRGDQIHDRVEVVEIGPGGFVCQKAPYIARGEQVEITIDDGDKSYRFRARGVWLKEDGDDYRVGFQLIGMPVCLRKVAISEHQTDVVDRLAA